MTNTIKSHIVILLALIAAIVGVVGVILDDPNLFVPNHFAHIWRIIIMAQGGIFLGLLIACANFILKLKVDPSDRLLRPLGGVAAASAIISVYAILNLVNRLTLEYVTWRSPVLFIGFGIGDFATLFLIQRLREVVKLAVNRKAIIKLTFLDTHLPGPDIDLGNNSNIRKA